MVAAMAKSLSNWVAFRSERPNSSIFRLGVAMREQALFSASGVPFHGQGMRNSVGPVAGHGAALDGGAGQLVETEPVAQDLQQPQLFLFDVQVRRRHFHGQ